MNNAQKKTVSTTSFSIALWLFGGAFESCTSGFYPTPGDWLWAVGYLFGALAIAALGFGVYVSQGEGQEQ